MASLRFEGLAAGLGQGRQRQAQRRAVGPCHGECLAGHRHRLQLPGATGVEGLLHPAAKAVAAGRQAPQRHRASPCAVAAEPAQGAAVGQAWRRQADAGHGGRLVSQLVGQRQQGLAAEQPPGAFCRACRHGQPVLPVQRHPRACGMGHAAQAGLVRHGLRLRLSTAWQVEGVVQRRPACGQPQVAVLAAAGVEAQRHPQQARRGVGQQLHLPGQAAIRWQRGRLCGRPHNGSARQAGQGQQASRSAGGQPPPGPGAWAQGAGGSVQGWRHARRLAGRWRRRVRGGARVVISAGGGRPIRAGPV